MVVVMVVGEEDEAPNVEETNVPSKILNGDEQQKKFEEINKSLKKLN